MKTAIIIPARLHSSRLPEKVLADLGGKPLIQRVYEACLRATEVDEVWIACDHERIEAACRVFTQNVIRTGDQHESGTDRIAEAARSLGVDYVINVQGDEPFIDASTIDAVAIALREGREDMVSVYALGEDPAGLEDPNTVKVVCDTAGYALYFSRAPIPFPRDGKPAEGPLFQKHIGLYGYASTFLQTFAGLPATYLEQTEKLEQLRALAHGYKIKMLEVSHPEKGIDTPEDLEQARKKFNV
ncbi:MAG: 3-deoxy-manno-octulosonate cytidylyltransferase [Nitritalea sp.]